MKNVRQIGEVVVDYVAGRYDETEFVSMLMEYGVDILDAEYLRKYADGVPMND